MALASVGTSTHVLIPVHIHTEKRITYPHSLIVMRLKNYYCIKAEEEDQVVC